jgi:hypothetical protein
MILIRINSHTAFPHLIDLSGVAINAPGGTTNQKVASSSLAGRTTKNNSLQKIKTTKSELQARVEGYQPIGFHINKIGLRTGAITAFLAPIAMLSDYYR